MIERRDRRWVWKAIETFAPKIGDSVDRSRAMAMASIGNGGSSTGRVSGVIGGVMKDVWDGMPRRG